MKIPWHRRLRTELRDLLELFLLPALAVVLPWRWCFRVFEQLARCPFLYREACDKAHDEASLRGWVRDTVQWKQQRRLVTLIDHADLFLVCTRSRRWLDRHLDVQGHWPNGSRAALLCTFHWGAGMWVLPHMQRSGLQVHALVAPLEGAPFAGRRVLHAYAKWRTARVASELAQATLDVRTSLRPALQALKSRQQVLAVVDVPADQVSSSEAICLLGRPARVPRALFRLAVEQQVPISLFVIGICPENGRRFLRIHSLGTSPEVAALVATVFQSLENCIHEQPAAWHFWSEAERFFEDAVTPPVASL